MPETTPLQPLAPWVSLASTDADWDALDPRVLDTMLAQLHLVRTFEEEVLGLAGQKLINGPAHASIGQEAGAVGSVLPLVGADQVNGTHRGHHQFLAKAIGYVAPDGVDPRKPLPEQGARGAAQEHGGDRRAQGRLLLRPRRLDAPAVDRRRGDGHQRDRRGRGPVRRRLRLRRQVGRHRQRLGHLLRRRRHEHRLGAGDDEPRRGVEAPGLLLHREQPVRRVDDRPGGDRRAAALRARAGLRHPQLAGRRPGRRGGVPRHAAGLRAHA